MSEWLTTGQMIDKIKLGEIAKPNQEDQSIKRTDDGLYWISWNGKLDEKFHVTDMIMEEYEWQIQPHYVTFEEVVSALRDEKTVYFHFGDEAIEIWCERQVNDLENKTSVEIGWRDLVFGKWTIQD